MIFKVNNHSHQDYSYFWRTSTSLLSNLYPITLTLDLEPEENLSYDDFVSYIDFSQPALTSVSQIISSATPWNFSLSSLLLTTFHVTTFPTLCVVNCYIIEPITQTLLSTFSIGARFVSYPTFSPHLSFQVHFLSSFNLSSQQWRTSFSNNSSYEPFFQSYQKLPFYDLYLTIASPLSTDLEIIQTNLKSLNLWFLQKNSLNTPFKALTSSQDLNPDWVPISLQEQSLFPTPQYDPNYQIWFQSWPLASSLKPTQFPFLNYWNLSTSCLLTFQLCAPPSGFDVFDNWTTFEDNISRINSSPYIVNQPYTHATFYPFIRSSQSPFTFSQPLTPVFWPSLSLIPWKIAKSFFPTPSTFTYQFEQLEFNPQQAIFACHEISFQPPITANSWNLSSAQEALGVPAIVYGAQWNLSTWTPTNNSWWVFQTPITSSLRSKFCFDCSFEHVNVPSLLKMPFDQSQWIWLTHHLSTISYIPSPFETNTNTPLASVLTTSTTTISALRRVIFDLFLDTNFYDYFAHETIEGYFRGTAWNSTFFNVLSGRISVVGHEDYVFYNFSLDNSSFYRKRPWALNLWKSPIISNLNSAPLTISLRVDIAYSNKIIPDIKYQTSTIFENFCRIWPSTYAANKSLWPEKSLLTDINYFNQQTLSHHIQRLKFYQEGMPVEWITDKNVNFFLRLLYDSIEYLRMGLQRKLFAKVIFYKWSQPLLLQNRSVTENNEELEPKYETSNCPHQFLKLPWEEQPCLTWQDWIARCLSYIKMSQDISSKRKKNFNRKDLSFFDKYCWTWLWKHLKHITWKVTKKDGIYAKQWKRDQTCQYFITPICRYRLWQRIRNNFRDQQKLLTTVSQTAPRCSPISQCYFLNQKGQWAIGATSVNLFLFPIKGFYFKQIHEQYQITTSLIFQNIKQFFWNLRRRQAIVFDYDLQILVNFVFRSLQQGFQVPALWQKKFPEHLTVKCLDVDFQNLKFWTIVQQYPTSIIEQTRSTTYFVKHDLNKLQKTYTFSSLSKIILWEKNCIIWDEQSKLLCAYNTITKQILWIQYFPEFQSVKQLKVLSPSLLAVVRPSQIEFIALHEKGQWVSRWQSSFPIEIEHIDSLDHRQTLLMSTHSALLCLSLNFQFATTMSPKIEFWKWEDIAIRSDDFVQPQVYQKAFLRLWDNLKNCHNGYLYRLSNINWPHDEKQLLIGYNEPLSNEVFNRAYRALYENYIALVQQFIKENQ